jgi:stage IV sporulation protein FB
VLTLRLGGIPVRIRGLFLVMAGVLGMSQGGPDVVAVWIAIVFVSVLVHELGHALVGRMFGLTPQIELHAMGGTTSWIEPREVGHARGIAISLAGPFAGFAIAALIFASGRLGFHPQHPLLRRAFEQAFQVNLYWGIFNLAPLLPLDGGSVLRGTLNLLTKGRGEKPARIISILMGGVLLAFAALAGAVWLGALGAFFTWANVQAYRQADTRAADAPLAAAIKEAYVALEHHDGERAIGLLQPVLVPQTSEDLRAIALRIYSYALLIEGMWDELLPMLEKNAALIGPEELSRYSRTARELGRATEADRIADLVPRPRAANDFG